MTARRPSMDWTLDIELPQRFKRWKFEVECELKLFQGDGKTEHFLQSYIEVCAGEAGQELLEDMTEREKPDPEKKGDFKKIFKFLEKKIQPTNMELQAATEYFFCRQGETTLTEFVKKV